MVPAGHRNAECLLLRLLMLQMTEVVRSAQADIAHSKVLSVVRGLIRSILTTAGVSSVDILCQALDDPLDLFNVINWRCILFASKSPGLPP